MEAVLCFLSFSLTTTMSLALIPIFLVESGMVPHAGFLSLWCSGMSDSVSTLTHLCSLKGIVSPGVALVARQVQSFNLKVLACL